MRNMVPAVQCPFYMTDQGPVLGTSNIWESSLKLGQCLSSSASWILKLNPKLFLTESVFSLDCISSEHWPSLTYFVQDLMSSPVQACLTADHKLLYCSIWLLSDNYMFCFAGVIQVQESHLGCTEGLRHTSSSKLWVQVLCNWTLQQLNQLCIDWKAIFNHRFSARVRQCCHLLLFTVFLGPSVGISMVNIWSLPVKRTLLDIQIKCFTLKATLYIIVWRGKWVPQFCIVFFLLFCFVWFCLVVWGFFPPLFWRAIGCGI